MKTVMLLCNLYRLQPGPLEGMFEALTVIPSDSHKMAVNGFRCTLQSKIFVPTAGKDFFFSISLARGQGYQGRVEHKHTHTHTLKIHVPAAAAA